MYVEIDSKRKVTKLNCTIHKEDKKVDSITSFWLDTEIPLNELGNAELMLSEDLTLYWVKKEIPKKVLSETETLIYETNANLAYLICVHEMKGEV